MASTGSLPSVIDAKTDGSLLLHATNLRGPRFKFLECRRRNFLELTGSRDSAFGFLRVVGKDCARSSLCCERRRRRGDSVRPRVINKGSADGGDSESEDALQATIEKSKQVLAKQRDLLQQISERRKLISSINSSSSSSTINRETTEVSSEGNNGTFSTQGSASTSDSVEDHSSEGTLSRNDVHSSIDEVPEFLLSPVSKGFTEKKEPETSIPPKQNPLGVSSSKQASTADEVPEFLLAPVSRGFNQNKKEPGTSLPSKQTSLSVGSAKIAPNLEIPSFLSFSSASPSVEDIKDGTLKGSGLPEKDVDTNEPVIEDNKPPPLAGANVMNVILVAAECAPWSKTGGLGDVAGALPKALARRGHRVMVVVPLYENYAEVQNTGVRKRYKVEGQDMEVVYYHTFIDGVDFVFIEGPMFRHLDNNIYGGSRMDILKRMVLFCKAAVEVPWHVPCGGVRYGDGNLVFIANDWHTALLPVYLKAYYRDNGLMSFTRSVLVIHNIAHQGRGPVSDFSCVDLPPHYLDLFKLYDPVGGDHFNIFAAGLKTADRVVTVSHGYAWEIKTSEGGWGLHGIINENDWKLTGIVNGIDSRDWNPQFDTHLTSDGYCNYSLETLQTGKPQCKAALQKELGLPVRDDVPLIGFIGRLDHQKGVDLIGEAIPWMMEQGVQLVMLGTGRADLEQMLRHFENQYNDKIRGWVGFSVKTAHRITAGADILLMPSRFEPCGLNQLYAMNYGTVPVVHAVGGLRDTVQQFDPYSESGLGWTFDSADTGKLIHALGNCLLTYREYKKSWEGLQRRGMMQDLSWDNVAHSYEEVLVAAKYHW